VDRHNFAESLGTLGVTEEQVDLLGSAEGFCRERSPVSRVRELMVTPRGYDAHVWAEIGALGWLGIAVPEAFGGVGLGLAEVVPVMEQMGRRLLETPFFATTLAGQAILKGGTAAQKGEWLPKIAGGMAATVALSEDNGDWDLGNVAATAMADGDGYVLSGTKTFVQHAEVAELIVVSAKVEGEVGLFLIAGHLPDAALRREIVIDETKRSYELNLDGLRAERLDSAPLGHIDLVANLLGAAELVGGAQAVIDYTVEYLKTRTQFGKPIGAFQALKHPTVDAYMGYEKARSLLYAAAHSFGDQGKAEVATRMAKARGETALAYAADRSIQFHGGFGFTYDCDAQLYRRRAIWGASQWGDAVWQKRRLAEILLN